MMSAMGYFANHAEEVESGILSVSGYLLLSSYRAGCVTAFAGNFYLILPSILARVATVSFARFHHTVARNMRTRVLLWVIHLFLSKIILNEKIY